MTQQARDGELIGSVAQCRRHPVKSMQGLQVEALTAAGDALAGDRARGVLTGDGVLLSAKQRRELLSAAADDEGVDLPDGRRFAYGDGELDEVLSTWLGTAVRLVEPPAGRSLQYRMTFDPPDDDAELFDIPTPAGTFLDLAPVHLLTTATLDGVSAARPDLDWDVRRFRPNLVLDVRQRPSSRTTGPAAASRWATRWCCRSTNRRCGARCRWRPSPGWSGRSACTGP